MMSTAIAAGAAERIMDPFLWWVVPWLILIALLFWCADWADQKSDQREEEA